MRLQLVRVPVVRLAGAMLGLIFVAPACGGIADGAGSAAMQQTSVALYPPVAQLRPGGARTFVATVTGASTTSVTWSVDAGGGTIDGSGRYTAPATTGTFHVTARSTADTSLSGSAVVLVSNSAPAILGTGGAWVNVSPPGVSFSGVSGAQRMFVDPARPQDIYSFVTDVGLLKSTDYGQTWTAFGNQAFVPGRPWGGDIQHDVARNPSTPPVLYICSGYGRGGLWKSVDGGLTWSDVWSSRKPAGITSSDIYNATIDPYDVNHVIVTFHDIIAVAETTDGGGSWHVLSQNAFSAYSDYCYFVDTGNPTTTRTRILCWSPWPDAPNTYLSQNGGASWTNVASGFGHLHGAFQPFQAGPGGVYYAPTVYGLMRSTDLGATWTNVSSGSKGGHDLMSMVLGTDRQLYLTEANSPWGFGTSPINDGVSWTFGSDALHAEPAGMTDGPAYGCTTTDGLRWTVIVNAQSSGIWRYIEP
jgi:hypothetical protein